MSPSSWTYVSRRSTVLATSMLQNRLRQPHSTNSAASHIAGPTFRSFPSRITAQTPMVAATMPSRRTSEPSSSKMTRFSHGIANATIHNSRSANLRIVRHPEGGAVPVDDGLEGEGLPCLSRDPRPGLLQRCRDASRECGGVTHRDEAPQAPVLQNLPRAARAVGGDDRRPGSERLDQRA